MPETPRPSASDVQAAEALTTLLPAGRLSVNEIATLIALLPLLFKLAAAVPELLELLKPLVERVRQILAELTPPGAAR